MVQRRHPADGAGADVPADESFPSRSSRFVVPAIIEPHSQYLTYFTCIVIFLQLIHQIVAMSGLVKVYKEVLPDTKGGKILVVGMVMGISMLAVNVLACLHEAAWCIAVQYYAGQPHILLINVTNIIVLASINGLQLVIAPTHFMSMWSAPEGGPARRLHGQEVHGLRRYGGEWVHDLHGATMGLYFLAGSLVFAVHLVDGVSSMIYHPLYTLGAFIFCTITINNMHSLQLQTADGRRRSTTR